MFIKIISFNDVIVLVYSTLKIIIYIYKNSKLYIQYLNCCILVKASINNCSVEIIENVYLFNFFPVNTSEKIVYLKFVANLKSKLNGKASGKKKRLDRKSYKI